jgi:hypothetical protein
MQPINHLPAKDVSNYHHFEPQAARYFHLIRDQVSPPVAQPAQPHVMYFGAEMERLSVRAWSAALL